LVAAGINRDRDFIVIDQRGTLHARTRADHEIDEFVAAATGMSIMAASTAEKDLAAVRACHARLVGDGNDLASFDTSENASDIADLRTALGIREWNVYGVSYGNDLALQLLRDHPDGIRSLTVDSNGSPTDQPDRTVLAECRRRVDGIVRCMRGRAHVRACLPRPRRWCSDPPVLPIWWATA
jgi:pimeloyl-ACP methyl ester carboxylesterase